MIGSKVIEILRIFSTDEIKDFEVYLSSPFFNKRKSLLDFYKYIIQYHPIYNKDFSDLVSINKFLKEKNKVDLNHTVKLFSFLYKELEQYIIITKNNEDKLYTQNLLSLYFNHNNLDSLYENACSTIEIQLKNTAPYNIIHYQYHENKCSFLSKNDIRKGDINYIPLSDSLDTFYYYNKLRLFCLMLNRSLVLGLDYSNQYLDFSINENIIKKLHVEAITIYYKIFTEFRVPYTKESYNEILSYLDQYDKKLSIEDLRIIYTILTNFSKNIYLDKNEYYQKLFYLYQRQLDLNVIYYDGKIHVGYLKNIVILAIITKELKWAENFLFKHKELITPIEENFESYFYLMSEVLFAKQDYNKALDMLSKTKSNDILIKLSIKRMYLKIFFELNEDNIFESNIASYKVYIGREKTITLDKKEAEKNFVNTLSLIWKYKLSKQKNKISQLIVKINKQNISDKNWLLATIDEILNNK